MAGVVESVKGSGVIGIVIFIVALIGNILNWIAFTTSSWARQFRDAAGANDYYSGLGLWRFCTEFAGSPDATVGTCVYLDGTNVAHFGATQAFVSIGFAGFNIMFLIILLKMFTGLCSSVGDIDKINAIQAIITAVCYLIGIIIFGAEYGDGTKLPVTGSGFTRNGDLGYSFILAIFAMVIQIVVAVIILITSMKGGGAVQASK